MGNSKIVFGSETLIDLTDDTVSPSDMRSGSTAHDKAGDQIIGTLVIHTVITGTSEPDDSIGSDGDIYLKLKE